MRSAKKAVILLAVLIALLFSACNPNGTDKEIPSAMPTVDQTAAPPSAMPTVDQTATPPPVKDFLDQPIVTQNGLVFDEPLSQAFNYCPSIIQAEDGTRYVYYCAVKDSGVVRDHIYCRKGTPDGNGGYSWGAKTLVLAPTPDTFDSLHCCDPSVIQGNFSYKGKTYKYLMAYTGNTSHINNKVGLALSNDLMSGWISTGEPLVVYNGDPSHWGVGQPSLLSVDKNGTVMLFYAYGGNKTCTYAEKWDLSNVEDPVRLSSVEVTDNGIEGLNGSLDTLNNIDVAYDPISDRYYIVRDTHPYPNDGEPSFVASHFSVAYIEESGRVGDLFTAEQDRSDKKWTNVFTTSPDETGFPRNSNCGIVRDPFGWTLTDEKIDVLYSISLLGDTYGPDYYAWTYRLYWQTVRLK